MEGKKLFCTDIYISIDTDLDIPQFEIIERDRNLSISMEQVLRDDAKVFYHATCYFELTEGLEIFFQVESEDSREESFLSHFDFILPMRVNRQYVSDTYWEFAPREGAITHSSYGYMYDEDSMRSYTGHEDYDGPEAKIELHSYECHDDV